MTITTTTENKAMNEHQQLLEQMYADFNARDIDGVLAALCDDVAWANGMDGGHEHGLEAVRAYWTRQWAVVSPRVVPVSFSERADGTLLATVQQSVRDLDGNPLQGQTHGLHDKLVGHVFQFADGKVIRFDIEDVD
jgi:ketosteroid isomerase-like protein